MNNKFNLKTLSFFGIIGLCITLVLVLQSTYLKRLTEDKNLSLQELQKEDEQKQINLQVLKKIPSFGFKNLVADWTFLQFLQYFGDDQARNQTGYRLSPEYFDVIVNSDPLYPNIHHFITTSVSIYSVMPEKSVALVDKILESMTPQLPKTSYYTWRSKAIDELLFLGDSKAAQESFIIASQWASLHNDEESQNVARNSYQTAQFLENNPDSKNAQISAWTTILGNAVDEHSREIAINKIEELGAKIEVNSNGQMMIIPPQND